MALAESQCYTIINTPELSDVFNEMKIKKDLGKFRQWSCLLFPLKWNSVYSFGFQNYRQTIEISPFLLNFSLLSQNKVMKIYKSTR